MNLHGSGKPPVCHNALQTSRIREQIQRRISSTINYEIPKTGAKVLKNHEKNNFFFKKKSLSHPSLALIGCHESLPIHHESQMRALAYQSVASVGGYPECYFPAFHLDHLGFGSNHFANP